MTKKLTSPQVKVEVTAEIIAQATECDSEHCMIAEAVKAAFPGSTFVSVDLQTIRFSEPEKHLRYTYLTPRVAQIALVNFDQGRKPEPFTFQLRRGQVTRSGGRTPKTAGNGGDPGRRITEEEEAKAGEMFSAGASTREVARELHCGAGTASRIRQRRELAKVKLVQQTIGNPETQIPDRIGGKTPPLAPLARRRAFGLRALER